MTQRHIGTLLDRKAINDINDNFTELYNEYIGAGLDAAEAKEKAIQAVTDAAIAKETAEVTREEMLAIIREQTQNGDLAPEIAQARQGKETLGENLNSIKSELAQNDKQRFFESMVSRKDPDGLYASWVDDDGTGFIYPRFKPILEDYRIPITSALITSKMFDPGRPSDERRKELEDLGMEFISHTHWHDGDNRPIDMTESELDYDFRTSQQIMKSLGYNHRGLVLPFGDNTPLIQKVARRYYDYVIGTGAAMAGSPQYPGEIDNYYIWRVTVQHGFDFVKEQLDEASEKGIAWVVFASHINDDSWYSDEYVRRVIDYAISLGFKFVTTQEGIDRFGNTAQFGNNKIAADGTVVGDDIGVVQYRRRDNGVSHNTPITDFPPNKVSITDINNPLAPNFPLAETGTLYTYRFGNDVYAYQRYISTRENHTHIRFWDSSNGTWKAWTQNDVVQYLGVNGILSNDSPLLARLKNKITYTQINSSGNSGFPENKSGLLVNYSHEIVSGYPFQEYHIYQEAKSYRRFWKNESWSVWESINGEKNAHQKPINSVTINTLPSQFEIGITLSYLTGAGDKSGFPSQESGILTTYHQSNTTKGFAYQEYKVFNKWDKYIRYEQSDGTWSAWKKFVVE